MSHRQVYEICRLCLHSSSENDMENIFKYFENEDYPTRLNIIANLKIYEGDGFPTGICLKCSEMVELTWDFVNQVKLSEHFVKQTYMTCLMPQEFGLPQIVVPHLIDIPENCIEANNIQADSGDFYSDELNNVQQEYEVKVENEMQPIYEISEINNQPTTSNDSSSLIAEKPFIETCPVCLKTFKTPGYLEKHLNTHATQPRAEGQGNFKCSHCPKYFTQRSFLEVHGRRHTGVKPFLCLYCPKRFTQSGNLAAHVRKHTGEKPYRCSFCGKQFTQHGNLKTHVQNMHPEMIRNGIYEDKNVHFCKICAKSFKTESYLAVHLLSHTSDPNCSQNSSPFEEKQESKDDLLKCPHCPKLFNDFNLYSQHQITHENSYKCIVCPKQFSKTSSLSRHYTRMHQNQNVPSMVNSSGVFIGAEQILIPKQEGRY